MAQVNAVIPYRDRSATDTTWSVDPDFTDAYHLSGTSPMRDRAIDTFLWWLSDGQAMADYDGEFRPQGASNYPDIGCDEVQ